MEPRHLQSMFGIGDNIFHLAVLRELHKRDPRRISLEAPYVSMYHDPIAEGWLDIRFAPRTYTAGLEPDAMRTLKRSHPTSRGAHSISYNPDMVRHHGSILASQFASINVPMPERPDYSMTVPQTWHDKLAKVLHQRLAGPITKPILVYRPIIRNKVWDCPNRAPDPISYSLLYQGVRDKFFVISVASVMANREWIVHPDVVDLHLDHGELDFQAMAALFKEADMVFANPGFSPVLAQAVGTPLICVYGGNESSKSTQAPGAHLSSFLAIEPDTPCDCHNRGHNCNKNITIQPAVERVKKFTQEHVMTTTPKTLIFATCYIDSDHRYNVLVNWLKVTKKLNPDTDIIIIDSQSPMQQRIIDLVGGRVKFFSFDDNIGHLSRPINGAPRGRDGWGRAFCKGLELAVAGGYDYAVHIEGDSLFRLPVVPIIEEMKSGDIKVATTEVRGTPRFEVHWVETGLMFFSTDYLKKSKFVERYDWPSRRVSPTPEHVIWDMVTADFSLTLMPWKAERGDKTQITAFNVTDFDWITHCWDHDEIYDAFVNSLNLQFDADVLPDLVKINLGCGTNRLEGWENHDADVDITKRLPWSDASVDFLFAEHVMEHVDYYQAINFLRECHRVLKPSGALRIAIPSVEQIRWKATQEYCQFTTRWTQESQPSVRGAMTNILYMHGHKAAWTASLLEASFYYVGFNTPRMRRPGDSGWKQLQGVEGHGRVIGDEFNRIETVCCEAEKVDHAGARSVSDYYDAAYFTMHGQWKSDYCAIAEAIDRHLDLGFKLSILDIGCGNGYIIKRLSELGHDCSGVDGSEHSVKLCVDSGLSVKQVDITKWHPFPWHDVVICTEVAEHIDERYADQLLDNITGCCNKLVIFSAAKPGSGGYLHVNEQPRDYWINKFLQRGFIIDEGRTTAINDELRSWLAGTWWFKDNLIVFMREPRRAL